MTRDGKILLGVLLLTLGVGIYGYAALKDDVRRAQQMASTCRCPYDTGGQVAAAQIAQHHRYATASHSYFERLLEGLVRHAGLPLQRAREDLKRSHGAYLPPDWKWLAPWEEEVQLRDTKPGSPDARPSPPPATTPGAPPPAKSPARPRRVVAPSGHL